MLKRWFTLLVCAGALRSVSALACEPVEAVVKLAELPLAAPKAIHTRLGDAQMGEILRTAEDGVVTYDVEMTKAGRTRSFTVNPSGDVLDEEVFLHELSGAVRKSIHAHLGRGGKVDEITRVTDEGETTYEVQFTRQGKPRDFTLSKTGRLLEMEMFLPELSPAVQRAVQKAAGQGTIGDIYKENEAGETLFEVDLTISDKTRNLTFDPEGALVAEQEPIGLSEVPASVRQAIAAQLAAGGKLRRLEKTTEDGEITYEVDIVRAGKVQAVTLTADGKLVMP